MEAHVHGPSADPVTATGDKGAVDQQWHDLSRNQFSSDAAKWSIAGVGVAMQACTTGELRSEMGPAHRAARSVERSWRLARRQSSSNQAFDGRRRQVLVSAGTWRSRSCAMVSSYSCTSESPSSPRQRCSNDSVRSVAVNEPLNMSQWTNMLVTRLHGGRDVVDKRQTLIKRKNTHRLAELYNVAVDRHTGRSV